MEPFVMKDKRLTKKFYGKKALPVLKEKTMIMDQYQFEQILKYLPNYLAGNDWHLMYSPTRHGRNYCKLQSVI